MQTVTTIGLDIAKSIFQVHGVDTNGNVLIRRKLKRRYVHSQTSGFMVRCGCRGLFGYVTFASRRYAVAWRTS
jgi:hypothetical protein